MTSTQILIRWLFFFAWLSILIVPAVLYCRIAIGHRKNGWVFFFFGIAIGTMSLNLGRLALYLVSTILVADDYKPYLPAIPVVVGYVLVFFAVRWLKDWFEGKEKNDSLDADL